MCTCTVVPSTHSRYSTEITGAAVCTYHSASTPILKVSYEAATSRLPADPVQVLVPLDLLYCIHLYLLLVLYSYNLDAPFGRTLDELDSTKRPDNDDKRLSALKLSAVFKQDYSEELT